MKLHELSPAEVIGTHRIQLLLQNIDHAVHGVCAQSVHRRQHTDTVISAVEDAVSVNNKQFFHNSHKRSKHGRSPCS